jgi:hypothetical protein
VKNLKPDGSFCLRRKSFRFHPCILRRRCKRRKSLHVTLCSTLGTRGGRLLLTGCAPRVCSVECQSATAGTLALTPLWPGGTLALYSQTGGWCRQMRSAGAFRAPTTHFPCAGAHFRYIYVRCASAPAKAVKR